MRPEAKVNEWYVLSSLAGLFRDHFGGASGLETRRAPNAPTCSDFIYERAAHER